MSEIRLHWFWSTNPQKIRFALNELGLEYELLFVDLRTGEQKEVDYRTINPRGKVPALEIDDLVLWESGAALLYLAQRYTDLWPQNTDLQAQALNLLFMESAAFQDLAGVNYYQKLIRPRFLKQEPDFQAIARTEPKLNGLLSVLDGVLGDDQWLLGDFSVVDIAYAPWLPYLDLHHWPRLIAWAKRLASRPAWTACLTRG